MVTIVIAQNEAKIKDIIAEVLREEGYPSLGKLGSDNIIKVVSVPDIQQSLSEQIVELGDSLYNEKRGTLYKAILAIVEKPLIEHVLLRTEGNQIKAAKILGMNRNTMRTKIVKLGIDAKTFRQ